MVKNKATDKTIALAVPNNAGAEDEKINVITGINREVPQGTQPSPNVANIRAKPLLPTTETSIFLFFLDVKIKIAIATPCNNETTSNKTPFKSAK